MATDYQGGLLDLMLLPLAGWSASAPRDPLLASRLGTAPCTSLRLAGPLMSVLSLFWQLVI